MALTGKLAASLSIRDSRSGDLSSADESGSVSGAWSITAGTGADQADVQWSDERTLGSGANEDLDLAGGLTGLFGAVTFVKLKAIVIVADPTNTTNLTVTRPGTNGVPFLAAAGDGFVLKPGCMFVLCDKSAAAIAVTAGTGDLINIANSAGATAKYKIMLVGTSA
jgi:hypothetical protein